MVPDWLRQPSLKELLVISGLTIATLSLSAYFYLKAYCDWFWDDLMLIRGVTKFFKYLGPENPPYASFDPAARLENQALSKPDKTYLLYEDQRWSFSEVNCRANQFANAIRRLGITGEQKAAVLMRNKPELLFTFYGCLKCRVPLGLLNTSLRTKALLHCIREASTRNLIVDDDEELLYAVAEIEEELQSDGVRIFVYGVSNKYKNLLEYVNNSEDYLLPRPEEQSVLADDVAAYIFTSGTTGLPKAAKITYNRLGAAAIMGCIFHIHEDDILYSPLPLFHSAALIMFNSTALIMGVTFAFAKKFSARNFWSDCEKHNATVIQYIGETCRYLLTRPPSELDRKHKVRMAIGNGLRRDVWMEFKTRYNIDRVCEFYAATEGNLFFGNLSNKFGSVGHCSSFLEKVLRLPKRAFLEYDIEEDRVVRGENGLCKQVPPGTPGLAVAEITSKSKFDGYSNTDQSESKILRNVLREGDAYFNTGDLMLWDTDYYVYFVDRIGDTFRWKGENVSTQEVGSLISDLDIIEDCSVYGVSIPGMDGKCGMSAIVLKTGISPTPDVLKAIHSQCEHHLPSYARPVFLRFMQSLHLTATFKHQKYNLERESFDVTQGSQIYVRDLKQQTYLTLTSQVYENIINGNMKM